MLLKVKYSSAAELPIQNFLLVASNSICPNAEHSYLRYNSLTYD